MEYSDIEIISLIRKGDKHAFEILFTEYYGRLCEYSNTICNNQEIAAEIVQDFLVKFWENRHRLHITSVKPYLFKSIHNNTVRHIVRKKSIEPIKNEDEYGSEYLRDFELSETLEKSIEDLPPRCREIFILSRMDNLRHKEIANKLGISERTVEVQIRKAGKILKEKMREYLSLLLF
jgi:RNA polymerase sigma-70 factor (ECF subfamily)